MPIKLPPLGLKRKN